MKNLKKTYKILLYLSIGLLLFFLFWKANGSPGFTPVTAMRMLERSYLVEDTELLLCEDGDNAVVNRRYKNVITTDGQYLYYCEMSGKTFLPWWEPGLWTPTDPLLLQKRGDVITPLLGNVQYRPYEDIRQQFSIPLYINPETEALPWDIAEATLTFDYRAIESHAWDCALVYHNRVTRNPDGLTILLFLDDRADVLGTPPYDHLATITYDAWDTLYYFDHTSVPITLTITLYDGNTPVHTETHDLAEWR